MSASSAIHHAGPSNQKRKTRGKGAKPKMSSAQTKKMTERQKLENLEKDAMNFVRSRL